VSRRVHRRSYRRAGYGTAYGYNPYTDCGYVLAPSRCATRPVARRRPRPDAEIGGEEKEINAALADPKIKAQLADLGGTTLGGSPGDFGKLIADETEKWAKVIREANIKPE
jgi:tripartite-type tricarboxylate transporter receptor subunit TctC